MPVLRFVLSFIKWSLVVIGAYFIFAMTVVRLIRHFYQFPIPSFFTPLIDNPVRRRIQPPNVIAEWMGAGRGMSILEISPWRGTFTFEVAQKVGDEGRVYAIDIQEQVVSALDEKIAERDVNNISVRLASAYELPFQDEIFDRVFMITVLGEIPDKNQALSEIKRVLKGEGLLAIGEFLPDPDYPRKSTVMGWCRKAGFDLFESNGNIMHYLLTFKKAR